MPDIYFDTIASMRQGFQTRLDDVNSKIDELTNSKSFLEDKITEADQVLGNIIEANPAAPTPLNFHLAQTDGRIILTWDEVGAYFTYQIDMSTAANFAGAESIYTGSDTSKVFFGIPSTNYYFRIKTISNSQRDSNYAYISNVG